MLYITKGNIKVLLTGMKQKLHICCRYKHQSEKITMEGFNGFLHCFLFFFICMQLCSLEGKEFVEHMSFFM